MPNRGVCKAHIPSLNIFSLVIATMLVPESHLTLLRSDPSITCVLLVGMLGLRRIQVWTWGFSQSALSCFLKPAMDFNTCLFTCLFWKSWVPVLWAHLAEVLHVASTVRALNGFAGGCFGQKAAIDFADDPEGVVQAASGTRRCQQGN